MKRVLMITVLVVVGAFVAGVAAANTIFELLDFSEVDPGEVPGMRPPR